MQKMRIFSSQRVKEICYGFSRAGLRYVVEWRDLPFLRESENSKLQNRWTQSNRIEVNEKLIE